MVPSPAQTGSINTALAAEPDAKLLGTFTSTYANMEPLHIQKTIYLPASFVGIFLDWDLTPMEASTRVRGAIVKGGL